MDIIHKVPADKKFPLATQMTSASYCAVPQFAEQSMERIIKFQASQ
jgi:hypothetical protein